jgi:prepilin-type processing-associated H-X9-DG protein
MPHPHVGDTEATSENWLTWTPKLDKDPNDPPYVTLADALNSTGQPSDKARDKGNFDTKRHKGKMNIVFADGHVQAYSITTEDLSNVYLLPQ